MTSSDAHCSTKHLLPSDGLPSHSAAPVISHRSRRVTSSEGGSRGALRTGLVLVVAVMALLAILSVNLFPTGSASTSVTAPTSNGPPIRTAVTPATTTGSTCASTHVAGTDPQLLPALCVSPTILCNPGSAACANYTSTSKVHLWVNSTQNSTIIPWVQVVFVLETTVYDGVYDPSQGDYGTDPCSAPCAESDGVPYFLSNVAAITQGITDKNVGVKDSSHVTFSLIDYFSNYNPSDPSTDSHDDGDGSEYNVDVSTFQDATTFSNTVTTMANKDPSPLFGGGCPSSGWNYKTHVYCDSDFSDNFLQASMITALYGSLHGSGLGWVNNSTTYHVVVWMGSTLPRDPAYPGYWCVTYNDEATSCPDATVTKEPSYTYASGVTEPAGETIASIATIAKQEHVIIDAIDLPNGMTELTPANPKVAGDTDYIESSSTDKTYATTDVTNILAAGCALATDTGGSWEGPSSTAAGVSYTCSAAATGTGQGNLSSTWNSAYPIAWSTDSSLGWALTNIKFPTLTVNYSVSGYVGEEAFQFIPTPGFQVDTAGMSYHCTNNGTDITKQCESAGNYTVGGTGHAWDWPLSAMYQGDSWSVVFNVSVVSPFPSSELNASIPIDRCLNTTQWNGCINVSSPFTDVAYTNYTQSYVMQSFPPADVIVVESASSIPTLTSISVSPSPLNVSLGGTQAFSASPVCSGGGGCPGGTTYTWFLSSVIGNLSTKVGPTTTFTAGNSVGVLYIYANGTLNGLTIQSAATTIQIETLTAVAANPSMATVNLTGTQFFNASTTCTYGPCPAGVTFYWSLTNNTLGYLSPSVGINTTFIAQGVAGYDTLQVNGTLGATTIVGTPAYITISSAGPQLSSVSVSPTSASIVLNGSQTFTATPACTGTCPSGTTYVWNLTSASLGTLTSHVGSSVTFTAGSTTGTVTLFVNASLNGIKKQSPAVAISVMIPTLSGVTVSPTSASVGTGAKVGLTASPVCSGGNCTAGTTYVWSMVGTVGTLSSTTGQSVTFTAGNAEGSASIFVNATLGKTTKQGGPVTITVVKLSGVAVNPTTATLKTGGESNFSASPVCAGGNCPSGTVYSWTLTSTLGTLSSNSAQTVTFTAGSTAGNLALFVNATLNGITVQSKGIDITITSSSSPLVSVAASPSSVTLPFGGKQTFAAAATCTSTCPGGIAYSWSLENSSFGQLSAATGSTTVFTAGSVSGSSNLLISATLDNYTVKGEPVPLTIPYVVSSVSISPTNTSVQAGKSLVLTATVVCEGGSCPSTITYDWSLGSPLGSLSQSTSSTVTYYAGSSAGSVVVTVAATVDGHTYAGTTTITVTTLTNNTTGGSSTGDTLLVVAVIACAAVAGVLMVFVLRGRRKKAIDGSSGSQLPEQQIDFSNLGKSS